MDRAAKTTSASTLRLFVEALQVLGADWRAILRRDPVFRAIHAEYVAALVLHLLAWVSETRVDPVEGRFEHEAACDPADYQRTLRCPVKFGAGQSELVLDAETLERPSLHADRTLAKVHEEFGEMLLAREGHPEVTRRVRKALAGLLESEARDLASVARRLGMSARSLQRRLAEEETSFSALLDDVRRELARHHLERRATPIEAVAYLTGFSEVSAFTRAARRWFGHTPARMREEAGGGRR